MNSILKKLAITPSVAAALIGLSTASNATIVTVSPNFTNGYMEVFGLDGAGGLDYSAFQFGSGWAVSDIKSTVGESSVVLEANYNTYADNAGSDYWRNNGGAGPGGNKWMIASTFAASSATFFTDNVCNFKTEISNYTFTPGYTVRAYIKCFAGDYSSNDIVFSAPLTANSVVDLTLSTTGWANVQYGFEVQGVNANPDASPGSATAIANVVPTVSTLTSLALSSGTLSPAFDSGTTSYTASVTNATASVTLTPTVTDSTATVKVNGVTVASGAASAALPLVVGSNTLTTEVTAEDGSTTSTYTVTVTRALPVILTQPVSQTVSAGSNVSFTVVAAFTSFYQWLKNAVVITDATSATLSLNNVQAADAANYSVRVYNINPATTSSSPVNYVTSDDAVLTVQGLNTVSTLTLDMIAIGNAGNAADTTTYGSVSYAYDIGKTEVTTAQYVAFLNATASTVDTYGLYNVGMANMGGIGVGISQTGGVITNFTYSVTGGGGNRPVAFVSWFDAARFSNWMTTGQGTTTETGSYTLAGAVSGSTVARNESPNGPYYYIPTENEWYKAAYYNPGTTAYSTFPNGQATITTADANYANAVGTTTDVGTYSGDPSSYGTFDQGGNVREMVNLTAAASTNLVARGGSYVSGTDSSLASSSRTLINTNAETITAGFRVSVVPDPSSALFPAINTQPVSQTVTTGSNVSFTVSAAFATFYQWLKNAVEITNANSATLSLTNVQAADAANYSVRVYNINPATTSTTQVNYVTSDDAVLTVRAPSTVSTLTSLALSSGTLSPSFDSGTTSYTTSVTNATASVTLTPTVTDSTATVKVNGVTVASGAASASLPLVVGSNTLTTVVTAQDGTTTSTYTVTVTRPPSAVSTLESLALSSGTLSPAFDSGTTSYTANVTNETASLTLTPTVTDNTATVKVNGVTVASGAASASLPLVPGSNTLTTVVTAEDGSTTSTYTVVVTYTPPSYPLFTAAETALPLANAGLVTLSPLAQFSVVTGTASHGGVDALKFTTVDNGTTYAERTVVGPSVVSFWWRVSSEEIYDLFKYSVNGVQQQAISGDGAWAFRTFTLAAGTHQIRWSYTKDSADASFDDAGYLDDLVIVDAYKDLQVTLAEAVVTGSGTLDFGSVQQSSAAVARSLTLKNNGTIPLAVTATIPSNSGFAFSTGLLTRSFTINAGQQTALDMKMLTATGGQKTALLGIVATGSLTAPPAVTLSGFIQPAAPVIACSWSGGDLTSGQSTAVDFGTAPSDVTFTVANTGTGVLSLSTVTVSPEANFQVTSQPASTVGINGTTTFTVRALDANRGNHLATVTVASDAPNAPSFTIPVTSQSTPNIACSWSGGDLTSGQSTAVDFGTAPSDVTFTVANTGTGVLSLSTVTVSPEANFQVISQPASTVAINGSTTFTVRALDANRGNHLATVTVASDAPNAPSFTIPVTSQSTPNIACSWSGGDLTSGQSTAVDFGTAPSDVTFTVANTGTGVLSLSTVTVSPEANFQVTSQPASTVGINGSTTFTVRALDANRGNHLATVTVASDAPNAPSFTIPVTSQSTPNIACSWSGGDLTSGQSTAVDFGTAPSEVTFTVANTGTGLMSLSTVTVSPEANFQVTSQPATTVAINGTTTFTVRALDANRGNHLATVTVASDAPNAPSFTIPVTSRVLLAVAGTGAVDGSLVNTGTAALWDMASTVLADGSTGLAMKTGTTPNSGNSTFGATFEGPGILSWNWKVSAQQNYDWLLCEVNGVEVAGISTKTAAWQSQVLQIPAGSQVRWIYRKDAANSSGTDSGHLADIRFSKFATAQSSFDTWSAARGGLAPTQVLPKGGMQAMFAWLGGVDPTTGPAVGTYQPSVSSGIYQYRYRVDKGAGGMTQPQVSTDLVNWDSRRMKQTLISEDSTSAVIELSVAATGKTFSRLAANVPAPTGFVYVAAGTLPSSSGLSGQSVSTFYIAKTETTWGKWQSVRTYAAANGYDIGNSGTGNGDDYPVQNVSWYQVVKWCNARSEQEGLTPVYRVNGSVYKTGESAPTVDATANGYRLPTEAQWEFAARGGVSTQNYEYSGSNDIYAVAWWYYNAYNSPRPVATKLANELGVSDMSGSVWEWCESWYPGYEGAFRVLRGGSWDYVASYCRVANRDYYYPSDSFGSIGFRVARSSVQ